MARSPYQPKKFFSNAYGTILEIELNPHNQIICLRIILWPYQLHLQD